MRTFDAPGKRDSLQERDAVKAFHGVCCSLQGRNEPTLVVKIKEPGQKSASLTEHPRFIYKDGTERGCRHF